MEDKESKSQSKPSFDAEKLTELFRNFFFFKGELSRAEFTKRVIYLAPAALFSLFWFALPAMQSLLLLATIVSLSSLIVRRLRNLGYHWAIVFVGLFPVLGWLALAIIVSLKPRSTDDDAFPVGKIVLSSVATFLALALVFTSLGVANTDVDTDQTDTVTTSDVVNSELEEQETAAELERIAAEEAEAARIADLEKQEAEKAAAEEAARAAEEAEVQAVLEAEQKRIDQTFEELVAGLKVEPEFIGGYERSLFRHWIDASGNGCDTRREVLISESLTPVTVGSGCAISGGSWYSAFDGVTTTNASSFDIDHLVPLAEAWRSGAHAWDSTTRRNFANDLGYEMSLIAVSASSNRSKSDRDPAKWMPPASSFKCEYVYSWVQVKLRWSLSVDQSELAAINRNWSGCSISSLDLSPSPSQAPISTAPAPAPKTEAAPPTSGTAPTPPPADGVCVNINSASFEDLQQIVHIGPERATELISLRPFSSVSGLARINGISADGVRLAEIRAQGLACVG